MSAYDVRYPAVADLRCRAASRLPQFVFDYLDGGVGSEQGLCQNERALSAIRLVPRFLREMKNVSTECRLFRHDYSLPFGISPVGMAGLIAPGSEVWLARAAARANIPFILSNAGNTAIEEVVDAAKGNAWFQLYPVTDATITRQLLGRVESAGCQVLVVTVDVPTSAKRDRDLRNGFCVPPQFGPGTLLDIMRHPGWAMRAARRGRPRFCMFEPFAPAGTDGPTAMGRFIDSKLAKGVSLELLRDIRDTWPNQLIVKGILAGEDAQQACSIGANGILVSNHGGRQLDAAPATIDVLPEIRQAVGKDVPVLMDSGIRSGMDALRARALGADMVLSGRSFYYGVAALGERGADQVVGIFADEIRRGLAQLGSGSWAALDQGWLHKRCRASDDEASII